MIERCYSLKFHIKHPTYKDAIVHKEWHSFMNFREWMASQDWKDKELDKDILFPGNKLYSKDTCVFVDENINTLLLDCGASRGKYPIGVCLNKQSAKYESQVSVDGEKKHLGLFNTIEEASKVYRITKSKIILDKVKDIEDVKLKEALANKALELLN